ncbi:MAG: hypothetical protein K2G52_07255, partial [Muribaculaceae bacterium]|nr:hypothetical protein [Muribaculaceae bacterium]
MDKLNKTRRFLSMGLLLLTVMLAGCTDYISMPEESNTNQLLSRSADAAVTLQPLNDVMMQAFYWDVPVDEESLNGTWWDNLKNKAPELKSSGISAIWTPGP